METSYNATNVKEFEVTGVSRSGRVRKKSSKLLDFQSPDEVERKIYKRPTVSNHTVRTPPARYSGRGRPSLAALKARKAARMELDEENNLSADDGEAHDEVKDIDNPSRETGDEDDEMDSDEDINNVLHNSSSLTPVSDSDDDGFGELVADLVGTDVTNLEGEANNQKSPFRQSLYMTEKNKSKESRLERKDKGKARYTAYNMWVREHRKSSKYGKNSDIDYQAARRLHELWSNVSNKEKSAWKRKAKMQSARAKLRENTNIPHIGKFTEHTDSQTPQNSTFINRPTTSRTRKLAEDKQKANADHEVTKSSPKRLRSHSYQRNASSNVANTNTSSPLYIATNGSTNSYNNTSKSLSLNNTNKSILPTIEPIDAAAHLKLLGESLSIIGDRLKEHEGQIAVSGSLSVLLDSMLCSLGPLLCLTTRLPGLDNKPQLKVNLATTLDNIAYVMPGV